LLRADDNVNMRHPLENALAFLLGHAACRHDAQAGPPLLLPAERAEQAEEFLLRLGPDRAGVEDDQIGLLCFRAWDVAALRQQLLHDLGVALIHLTAEGFDVEVSGCRFHWLSM